MTKEQIIKKLAEIEKTFNDSQKQMQNLSQENLRLQGEYRLLQDLLKEDDKKK